MTAGLHVPAFVTHAHVGEPFWFAESLVTIKATSESTGGGLGVMHVHGPRGSGSPTHTHLAEDESWYVLEGELRFWLGDEVQLAGPGDFVFGPRSVAHRFCVDSDEARFLIIVNPGGFEGFVRSTGWPAARRELPLGDVPAHSADQIASAVEAHRLIVESS